MKQVEYVINGQRFLVDVLSFDGRTAEVRVNGNPYRVEVPAARPAPPASQPFSMPAAPVAAPPPRAQPPKPPEPVKPVTAAAPTGAPAAKQTVLKPADNQIVSPMPGIILKVLVQEGQSVSAGTPLLVLEAMKMENEIHAPRAGKVKKVHVEKGAEVQAGRLLLELE